MSNIALRQFAMTDTYLEVQSDIRRTVEQLKHRYGNILDSVDEVMCDANLLFVEAYNRYNPELGMAFSTWVRGFVWRGITEIVRRRSNQARLARNIEHPVAYNHGLFDFIDMVDALNQDSRLVVAYITNPPTELKRMFRTTKTPKVALKRYLIDIGWTAARIAESFNEIADAIVA